MVILYVETEYLDGPKDTTWGVNWLDFNAEIDKVLYKLPVSTWDEELGGSAYPGGILNGWFELMAPIGVEAKDVKLLYKPSFKDVEVWFAIE